MTDSKLITTLLLILLYSCGQNFANKKVDPAAIELNDEAMGLAPFLENPDSSKKAILLLDKATTIDSNYFLGYFNKLMFLNQHKQMDKAIYTINKLIDLQPSVNDLYLYGGFFYERIGDTVSAKIYFKKSLEIRDKVLDTMSNNNRGYEMFVINKATNLIMLGEEKKEREVLKRLYDIQTDEVMKGEILSLMDKTKKALIQQ